MTCWQGGCWYQVSPVTRLVAVSVIRGPPSVGSSFVTGSIRPPRLGEGSRCSSARLKHDGFKVNTTLTSSKPARGTGALTFN